MNNLNKFLNLFLTTYKHIPETIQFSSYIDDLNIVKEQISLLGLLHNDKIIFHKDMIEIYLYSDKNILSYYDIIKWTLN